MLKINKKRIYKFNKAIDIIRNKKFNFNESVDVNINLNINKNQFVNGSLELPYKIKKKKKIALLCNKIDNSLKKIIKKKKIKLYNKKLIKDLKKNIINFDILISNPNMLKYLLKFKKLLSSKNLIPSYNMNTLTNNIIDTIKNIEFKTKYYSDKYGIIHCSIGNIKLNNFQLKKNLKYLILFINKNKPNKIKGNYIKKIHLSTTMSKGIEIKILI